MKGFQNYILKFMEKARLVPKSGNVVVALSGGRDSMGLLHVASQFKKQGVLKNVRAFHVNHGTRPENDKEQDLVVKFCKSLEIPLQIFHPFLNPNTSNFEHFAREKRHELFFNNLENDEVLFMGHHIDDSFEWSLLRQFKSGSERAGLGIPVKNGPIRRPFNCVTREQIAAYVKLNSIPFIHDSSNQSLRFERNFIREKIVPQIAKRFPNYLKHFVYRSNQLALDFEVSALLNKKNEFRFLKDEQGILILHAKGLNDFRGAESLIIRAITSLSEKKRGTLNTQVEKIIEAAKNGKKGPLIFSGNVLGFINQGHLYFTAKKTLDNFKKLDESLLETLKNDSMDFKPISFEVVKNKIKSPKNLTFPFLTFAEDMPKNFPSLKKEHPLFPRSTEFGLKNGLWINTLPKLLFHWERGTRVQLKESYNVFNI